MRYEEEKPIFNLGFYNKESEKKTKNQSPEDILLWNKENIAAYLRGAFDGRGQIFTSTNGQTILSINHDDYSQIEIYQLAFEKLDIQSFSYFPISNGEKAQLFIVGNINIEKFKSKIGFSDSSEIRKYLQYLKGFDWED